LKFIGFDDHSIKSRYNQQIAQCMTMNSSHKRNFFSRNLAVHIGLNIFYVRLTSPIEIYPQN